MLHHACSKNNTFWDITPKCATNKSDKKSNMTFCQIVLAEFWQLKKMKWLHELKTAFIYEGGLKMGPKFRAEKVKSIYNKYCWKNPVNVNGND